MMTLTSVSYLIQMLTCILYNKLLQFQPLYAVFLSLVLVAKATPRGKPAAQKSCSTKKKEKYESEV